MTNEELKVKYGIDFKEGLARLLDDEEFYLSLLETFYKENPFSQMKKDFLEKDYPALFLSTHEMKGASGNLSLNGLFRSSSFLCDLTRKEPFGSDESINSAFLQVEKEYVNSLKGIQEILKREKGK